MNVTVLQQKKDSEFDQKELDRKERYRAYQKKYQREWAKRNPEKVKVAKEKYRLANREKIAASRRAKRAENRAKLDAAKRKWEAENPEKVAMQRVRSRLRKDQKAREGSLRFHYGVTAEEYEAILKMQGGVCAICGQENDTAKTNRLFVDHDHISGRVRALLCHHCNAGLGYFKESPELFERAAAYLEAFGGRQESQRWPERVSAALEKLPELARTES